ELPGKEEPYVKACFGTRCGAAGDQLSARFHALHALLPGRLAYVLKYDVAHSPVRDLSYLFRDLLLVVIDSEVCAEFARLFQLVLISGCRDGDCPKHFADLNCR